MAPSTGIRYREELSQLSDNLCYLIVPFIKLYQHPSATNYSSLRHNMLIFSDILWFSLRRNS